MTMVPSPSRVVVERSRVDDDDDDELVARTTRAVPWCLDRWDEKVRDVVKNNDGLMVFSFDWMMVRDVWLVILL